MTEQQTHTANAQQSYTLASRTSQRTMKQKLNNDNGLQERMTRTPAANDLAAWRRQGI